MTVGIDTPQRTSIDTSDEKARASANHGGQVFIALNGDGTVTRRGYLFFAPPFPLGATVFSATLKVTLYKGWSGANTITVKRITEAWSEFTLTWDNAPTVSSTHSATGSTTGGVDGDVVEIDVTDMMNDVAGGSPWFGVRLEVGTSSNRFLYSAENPTQANRAVLDIDWGVAPRAPVNLNPTGNQSISVTKPVLDWQFSSPDHSAKRKQTFSQVQVSTSTDFSSPSYDSGWVANTSSQWDLSAATSPTFNALNNGQVRYWRVRVKDDQELASEWSETAQFNRAAKGTLTLTNPPNTTPSTVDDLTPKVTWSLSGATQKSFELRLFRYDGSRAILVWKLPRHVSTATSYNIPKGYIKSTEQYRLGLLVWDGEDRAVTPGDPDFLAISRDFNYDRAGGPDPVLNLTAVTIDQSPAVHLTWHRSVAPDYFAIVRNDVEVLPRVDPDEVHVSGDEYEMNFWRATPGEASTYEVEAVEDDGSGNLIQSDGNDTDTATTDPIAIHLVDESDDTHVTIYGQDDANFQVRKVSTTSDVSGSRRPVQVVSLIGGYTDTTTGEIINTSDRDDFETLIGRTPTPLRLIIGDYNLEVELEDGAPSPTPKPGRDLFDVGFTWYQTDADETFSVTDG